MLEVNTRRKYLYWLDICFMDFDEPIQYFIQDKLIVDLLSQMKGHKRIRDMFPEIETSLMKECTNHEQAIDVEDWFNQDLEALLMPLSYY